MTPPLITDGIRAAMHRDEYDKIERVNFSSLKLMAWSPAHYRYHLITPTDDTDAKKLGRVGHLAVFEPERFRSTIAVWDGGTRRGKDWDAFCRKNEGLELLTEKELDRCMAIQAAVRNDPVAQPYLQNGRGEVSIFWTTHGVPCKGRIDFDSETAIVDLKLTKDASPDAFSRQAFSLEYPPQGAWYQDAFLAATGVLKPYVIVAVENTAPWVVQVYRVPDLALDLGREKYLAWLDQLAACRERARWPAYSDPPGELELPIPQWILPDDEDVLSELVIGSEGA